MSQSELGPHTDCRSGTALCRLLGHSCADDAAPGGLGERPRHEEWGPTPAGVAVIAHLLERWLPADPAGRPRWRVLVTTGRPGAGSTWPPTPAALVAAGLFALRLPDDPDGTGRLPAAVVPVPPDEAVPIAEFVNPAGGALDERAALLADELIPRLTNKGSWELARVEVAGRPEVLCLLRADHNGELLALTIAPAAPGPADPTDPACLVAGHRCPGTASEDAASVDAAERDRRALLVRGISAARVLGSMLYFSNNSFISYEFDAVAVPELDLSLDDPAADAALRAWWLADRPEISRDLQREDWDEPADGDDEDAPCFWPLAERVDLARARHLMRDEPDPDIGFGADGLAARLWLDMVDSAVAWLCPDGAAPLAYTAGWSLDEDGGVTPGVGWGDEHGVSALLLFGRRGIVRIEREFIE